MKKLDRINELVDELNELKLGCMAASLDSLYHSKSFDELDAVSLLEQVNRTGIPEQNIAEISEQTETGASCRRTSIIG